MNLLFLLSDEESGKDCRTEDKKKTDQDAIEDTEKKSTADSRDQGDTEKPHENKKADSQDEPEKTNSNVKKLSKHTTNELSDVKEDGHDEAGL